MTAIFDDKLVALRLAHRPEFRARLAEFLFSYGVSDRPALVAQARPAEDAPPFSIAVDEEALQRRFTAGVPSQSRYWDGFRSMVAVQRTFHGIGSLPAREQPAWAAEAHRDGHFIAGTWLFPEFSDGERKIFAIGDFFAEMFGEFLRLVQSTLGETSGQPMYEVTWTLTRAAELHYASASSFGRFAPSATPTRIPTLQAPIAAAVVGSAEWTELGAKMGRALTGAFGGLPPRQ